MPNHLRIVPAALDANRPEAMMAEWLCDQLSLREERFNNNIREDARCFDDETRFGPFWSQGANRSVMRDNCGGLILANIKRSYNFEQSPFAIYVWLPGDRDLLFLPGVAQMFAILFQYYCAEPCVLELPNFAPERIARLRVAIEDEARDEVIGLNLDTWINLESLFIGHMLLAGAPRERNRPARRYPLHPLSSKPLPLP